MTRHPWAIGEFVWVDWPNGTRELCIISAYRANGVQVERPDGRTRMTAWWRISSRGST